jgi:NAD(P) transhydrogenase subunit alpha
VYPFSAIHEKTEIIMKIGIPKETRPGESRVAITPDSVKKLVKKGCTVRLERGAGMSAGFGDDEYVAHGASLVDPESAWGSDLVLKVRRPTETEIPRLQKGAMLISLLEPYLNDAFLDSLAHRGVDSVAMEWIPRTSRAQAMDVLSSQANIAGYRAAVEAFSRYGRFIPLMMTSAGSAKAARVTVLGAGVAGLQAIATCRRLGAIVEAYDVRPEVKEQIQSLGAKFIEIDIGEQGSGQGGYARELSDDAKMRLQTGLNERLMKSDIIITTANVPGRRAPLLVSEEVVRGMRRGSVIVDMAAPSGGNCALTKAEEVVETGGVQIVGFTNYPAMMAADSSNFYGRNLLNLLALMLLEKEGKAELKVDFQDDILDAAVVTYQGAVRARRN